MVYAQNDDMGLGAIEAIEAAGKVPGKDIKIITVDAVKDGMQALADGKINYIVECNPLLGEQLMDLAKKVIAGEPIPNRVVTEGPTFDQAAGAEGTAGPQVLTGPRRDGRPAKRDSLGHVAGRPGARGACPAGRSVTDSRRRSSRCATSRSLSRGSRRSTASTSGCCPVRCTPSWARTAPASRR